MDDFSCVLSRTLRGQEQDSSLNSKKVVGLCTFRYPWPWSGQEWERLDPFNTVGIYVTVRTGATLLWWARLEKTQPYRDVNYETTSLHCFPREKWRKTIRTIVVYKLPKSAQCEVKARKQQCLTQKEALPACHISKYHPLGVSQLIRSPVWSLLLSFVVQSVL